MNIIRIILQVVGVINASQFVHSYTVC